MKHDKVFIIPERMGEFIPNNPNSLPWNKSEAFIGIPLFFEGKSFAHFGMIWSEEGAAKRKLSWTYIEMLLHSLEDMILQRILEGRGFSKGPMDNAAPATKIIPLDAITASQSLKPYARSLSHELRTPMQGVVGMLDIMHSTVTDAIDNQKNEVIKKVFRELKTNIELVQDSSKRAVEAADNVVHAYDLNMEMPGTPLGSEDEAGREISKQPTILDGDSAMSKSTKEKKRPRDEEPYDHPGPSMKRFADGSAKQRDQIYFAPDRSCNTSNDDYTTASRWYPGESESSSNSWPTSPPKLNSIIDFKVTLSPAHRVVSTRDFMHSLVINAVLGAHPAEQNHRKTERGVLIHIKTHGPHGEVRGDLDVELDIDAAVPESMVVEEHHLRFCLQKVVDNAIKFTESGSVTVRIKLSQRMQLLEIRVIDTGCGITEQSKAQLFKPHFQEDSSISRARDGLGLSLFNAKAQIRRSLGGDLTLERSSTEGPMKGSEFLIRLPLSAPLDTTRAQSPLLGSITLSRHTSPVLTDTKPDKPQKQMASVLSDQSKFNSFPQPILRLKKASKSSAFNKNLAKMVPLTFLIAEDNSINRNILVGYLKKLGYREDNIIQAIDGVEAVKMYQGSLQRPPGKRVDGVLMDLWMPNMDGYEATKKILEIAKSKGESLAVMAVTADITNESLEKAKETGMTGFVSKPFKVLDLEHMILEHFGKPQQVCV